MCDSVQVRHFHYVRRIQRKCASSTAMAAQMAGRSSVCLIPTSIDPACRTSNRPGGPSSKARDPLLSRTLPPVAKVAHPAPTLEWDTPLYQQALTQLEHALELADVPDLTSTRLRHPERCVMFSLPIEMDDGSYRSF